MKVSKGGRLLSLGALLVVIDQVIKVLVKTGMTVGEHFSVIPDWFQILFIENEGMAFGMAFGGVVGKCVLSLFRIALFGFLCWWIARLVCKAYTPEGKAVFRPDGSREVPAGVLVGLTLITAGAFGNIIDSLFYGLLFSASTAAEVASFGGHYAPFLFGKVVDMFYFPLFTWPSWVPGLGGHVFFEPVFNFADSCVTVGAFYLILFQWKFFARDEKDDSTRETGKGSVAGS